MNVSLPGELRLPQPTLSRAARIRIQLVYPALMLGFLVAMGFAGQLRVEHLIVVGTIAACFGPQPVRQFVDLFMPFVLTGLFYDTQRLWGTAIETPVHIAGPYLLEKQLFGIHTATGTITPNELFAQHHTAWVDVLAAFPYLTYIVFAIGFGILFYLTDKERCRRLGWVFMAVNLAGMLTEMFFKVAPPWYVSDHGLGPLVQNVVASPAATIRFDQLTGTHLFQSFYSRSTDVFGAMPSLHVAYPVLIYCYVRELRKGWLTTTTFLYACLMGFAAVYLQHHYVIDVIAGVFYASAGYGVDWWLNRR